MQVVLVMFRSDGERRSFSVVRNMTVIGRLEDCDLRIPVGDVSRKHCRLVRTDDGIRIEDLGSSNGTFVNGDRVQESELNAGDRVSVGPVQFVVQINGVPEDDEIAPPVTAAADPEDSTSDFAPAAAFAAPAADLDESSLDEIPLEEVPADDMTVDETPLTDDELEEVPFAEDAPAVSGTAGPDVTEPSAVENGELEEFPIDDAPTRPRRPAAPMPPVPPPLAEVVSEDEPEIDEFQLDELAEAPTENTDSDISPVELESGSVADAAPGAPAAAAPEAGEGEWDFLVEESEGERSRADFDIDLDSPQRRPQK